MRRTILSTLILPLATILCFGLYLNCSAVGESNNKISLETCTSPILEKIGKIRRTNMVIIGGEVNSLYCTFNNRDEALSNLRRLAPNILKYLSEEYGLDKMSGNNWKEYRGAFDSIPLSSKYSSNENIENVALSAFFDIYENYESNSVIRNYVSAPHMAISITGDDVKDIGLMLPYYAPLAIRLNENIYTRNSVSAASLPNVVAAVNYAEQYAWSPNSGAYHVFASDCTNFASQILEASGVAQDIYSNENYGWWHKKQNSRHMHSISWIRADTFARYMGVGFGTFVHRTFAQNIQVGDFITYDETYDGSWDHMGFVTYRANSEASHGGSIYRDYIVAQHTRNYNMWVSENGNGWENIGSNGGRYGRVRR